MIFVNVDLRGLHLTVTLKPAGGLHGTFHPLFFLFSPLRSDVVMLTTMQSSMQIETIDVNYYICICTLLDMSNSIFSVTNIPVTRWRLRGRDRDAGDGDACMLMQSESAVAGNMEELTQIDDRVD